MRKKILEKRLRRLQAKKQNLVERAKASTDANEVRAINDQMDDINDEIDEIQEEINAIDAEENGGVAPVQPEEHDVDPTRGRIVEEQRTNIPSNAQLMNGSILGAFSQVAGMTQARQDTDPYGSMEYRQAFKRHVQTGEAIPSNLMPVRNMVQRAGGDPGVTTTVDLGAIIPTTIMNEFIKGVSKVYGQIYAKVRKLNIPGGVKFPISDLKANFRWINESTVAPTEKAGEIKDFIEFSYNIGEIRVSQTLLSSIVALDLFESEITRIMIEAYVEAMDKGIVKGTGNGQMLGILNDPRVDSSHIISMSATDFANWQKWRSLLFAKIPLSKRGQGEFLFTASTVESYLLNMSDSNNRPIFKEATELTITDHNTGGKFFGRDAELVEPDIVSDFDTAEAGDVVGIYWNPKDYAINTNMAFGMTRWFDHNTNQWVNKGLTVVDGKLLDVNGIYIIKKKA